MALPNAADPIFDDHQEQESSSSTSSTSITIFENEQQRRNFFGNVQYLDVFLYLMIFFLFFCSFVSFLSDDGRTIYGLLEAYDDISYYGIYYIVKTFIMILLGSLFMYNLFVPRNPNIFKLVSITAGCLFIFDLVVMVSIADIAMQVIYLCGVDEKGFVDQKLHRYVELLNYNITNAAAMFLFSFGMSLFQILAFLAFKKFCAPRLNSELRV